MDRVRIDVHKRKSQISIVLGTPPRARIVIEASTDREQVARGLAALGHEVIVAAPNFAPMYTTERAT